MWVVTKVSDSGWEEIVSKEQRLPNHAHEIAEKKSREELGTTFKVYRLVHEATFESDIVTRMDKAT